MNNDAPPPEYSLYDVKNLHLADHQSSQQISREPFATSDSTQERQRPPPLPLRNLEYPPPPPTPRRAQTSLNAGTNAAVDGESGCENAIDESSPNTVRPPVSSSSWPLAKSHASRAFEEARHFAGGLIHHPAESTKHFSMLRHSHGLVYFQGPRTSIAVSIFADATLPVDRTIWLQCKGFTGTTGMRLKTFIGADGSWLNVTPTTKLNVEQLKATDERAWQRDIAHFIKRSEKHIRDTHKLRETAIVRIPFAADDGYFRLILCTGERKKVLCCSPTFRVMSTSTSPGKVKGASLGTLPLEIAAKIGCHTANTFTGNVAGNITAPYQSQIQQGESYYSDGRTAYSVGRIAAPTVKKKIVKHSDVIDASDQVYKDDSEDIEREEEPSTLSKIKTGFSEKSNVAKGHMQKAGIRVPVKEDLDGRMEIFGGYYVVR